MAMSTPLSVSELSTPPVKRLWEDPCLTLECALETRAQGVPPPGGPPNAGPNLGFVGPLNTSGGSGQCT